MKGYRLNANQVCMKERRCYCNNGIGADQCYENNMAFRCEVCDPGFELVSQEWTCKGKETTCSEEHVSCTVPQSAGKGDCIAEFSDVRSLWVLVSSRDVCSTCTEVEETVSVTIGMEQQLHSQVDASVSAEASGAFLTGSVSASMTYAITSTMTHTQEKSKTFTVSAGSSIYFWQLMVFWKINGSDFKLGIDRYMQTSSPDVPCPPSSNSTCMQTFNYQCPGRTVDHVDAKQLVEDSGAGDLQDSPVDYSTIGGAVGGLMGLGVLGKVAYMLKGRHDSNKFTRTESPESLDTQV